MARFYDAAQPVVCTTSHVAAGSVTLTSNGVFQNISYNVEMVLNLDGNDAYNGSADHGYTHPPITVGATNIVLSFDHNNAGAGGWVGPNVAPTPTWTGNGCPGG